MSRAPTALALLLAACSVEPTRIVVAVETDLEMPAELDALSIEVDATELDGSVEERTTALDGSTVLPPIVLAIVHDGGALGPITVRARGLHDGEVVVERAARLSFVRGRSLLLRLDLLRACLDDDCSGSRTCAAGSCIPLDLDAEGLPSWTGRDALAGADDAGTLIRDASVPVPDDAGGDATAAPGGDAAVCATGCECAQTCVGDEGCECKSGCACTLACVPGDDCTHVLCDGVGTACAIDGADTSNLEARCDHASVCTIDARGASNALALSCKNGSQCDVDCTGASNCELTCESGSQCLLRCAIDSPCDLTCSAGELRFCGDGLVACNRACP